MTKLWGLELSDIRWNAFRHHNMFNPRWHLRKERFVFYQLAMLISLAAECTATYSLSKYEDHQSNIERYSNMTARVLNNDIIDAEIVTIVFCVLVATIFGADFFFLLFWPQQRYPKWYNTGKRLLAMVICGGMLAAAITSTVVVSNNSELITGVSPAASTQLVNVYFHPPLAYHKWAVNVAFVVLLWFAFIFTLASTVLLWLAVHHDEHYGPEAFDAPVDEEKQTISR